MWLTPPIMNSQITFLALGAKCGLPSGGVQLAGVRAGDAVAVEHGAEGQAGEAHAQCRRGRRGGWSPRRAGVDSCLSSLADD